MAFADWMNHTLADDPDVAYKLKLAEDGSDMYEKMDDGVMLCKIINLAAPDTVDSRVINKGKQISIFKVKGATFGFLKCVAYLISHMSHIFLCVSATGEPQPGHQLRQGRGVRGGGGGRSQHPVQAG